MRKLQLTGDHGAVTIPSRKTGSLNVLKCSVGQLPVHYKD